MKISKMSIYERKYGKYYYKYIRDIIYMRNIVNINENTIGNKVKQICITLAFPSQCKIKTISAKRYFFIYKVVTQSRFVFIFLIYTSNDAKE